MVRWRVDGMSKQGTCRMLVNMVKADRPDWSAKQCAEWLTKRMPQLRAGVRKATRDWIREDLLTDVLAGDSEEWPLPFLSSVNVR